MAKALFCQIIYFDPILNLHQEFFLYMALPFFLAQLCSRLSFCLVDRDLMLPILSGLFSMWLQILVNLNHAYICHMYYFYL